MIESLKLRNVGPASAMEVEWAPRFNVITGDNGLGKSFLLDIAWWALTRTWAGNAALPAAHQKGTIEYTVRGVAKTPKIVSQYHRSNSSWPLPQARPPKVGIVVYIRIDGGFSVWDPARNYWRDDPGRPEAYHFDSDSVWEGLDVNGERVCEGLERDWVSWQKGDEPQFASLRDAINVLSPEGEPIKIGPPQRVFLGEGRERPTLLVGDLVVPVVLASAGVRRILALAYLVVWAWTEHRAAAKLLGKQPENRFDILFDEPETHLHPRWQRTILPSLLSALNGLRQASADEPQLLVATHSPLVLASLEPSFDKSKDDLIHLKLDQGKVTLEQGMWEKQGDVTNWLVSEVFDLRQARSIQAERAIEDAEQLMRGEGGSRAEVNRRLLALLPDHDPFWPRWIVYGEARE